MTKILNKIINWGLMVLAFLVPLFFLPLTADFYEFNKNILLYAFTAVLLVAWVLRMAFEKKVSFRRSAFDLPLILLAVIFVVSTFVNPSNRIQTFLTPSATGTIVALTLLYFIITNSLAENLVLKLLNSLIASSVILALVSIYQFIGVGEAFAPTVWLKNKTWTPTGGLISTISFLIVALPLIGLNVYQQIKAGAAKGGTPLFISLIAFFLLLVGISTNAYQMLFTSAKPLLLPYTTGWVIAIDAFKNFPLIGVGPSNFLSAFTSSRPISFNMTGLWSIWFGVSSNWYFQLLTTVGVLGLGAFLLLIWKIVKSANLKNALSLSGLVALIVFALLPINFLLLFTFYLLLAVLAVTLPAKEHSEPSRILPWVILAPVIVAVAAGFYFTGRAYAADLYFKKSMDALSKNQGVQAYDLQIKAITLNPYATNYHVAYSQINFALADALARNQNISDQDRQNIATLLGQSIREGKAAVALNPKDITNWENLGLIYRRLINFVQGADSWSVAVYNQAINLDPFNPNLRLSLGGIYYGLQNYDQAIQLFQQTVTLKPDFANGYYNLAAAYRGKGDFTNAATALETALSLVPKDSPDYSKASAELDDLKKKLAEKAAAGGLPAEASTKVGELAKPEPLPTGIKPPLAFPTSAGPEVNPTTSQNAQPTP